MGTRVLSIVEKLSSLGNHDLLCKRFISAIGVNELSEINNKRLRYSSVIEYTLENCKSTILSTVVLNSMASFCGHNATDMRLHFSIHQLVI